MIIECLQGAQWKEIKVEKYIDTEKTLINLVFKGGMLVTNQSVEVGTLNWNHLRAV